MFKSGRKWDKTFLGTYEHSIDSKNRLSLPSRIVSKINEDVVVSKGFDGCLELRTLSAFEVYSEKLMQLSQNKKDSRIVIRQLLANAIDLSLDSAKRILIPNSLLAESNITKDVVIIGLGNKLEIWDKGTYQKFKQETDVTYAEIAEKIDKEE